MFVSVIAAKPIRAGQPVNPVNRNPNQMMMSTGNNAVSPAVVARPVIRPSQGARQYRGN